MPRLYDPTFVYSGRKRHELDVEAANQDLTDSEYQYFGFIHPTGAWIIQRFHIVAACIVYEYAGGRTRATYAAAWDETTKRYIGSFTFTTIDQMVLV